MNARAFFLDLGKRFFLDGGNDNFHAAGASGVKDEEGNSSVTGNKTEGHGWIVNQGLAVKDSPPILASDLASCPPFANRSTPMEGSPRGCRSHVPGAQGTLFPMRTHVVSAWQKHRR